MWTLCSVSVSVSLYVSVGYPRVEREIEWGLYFIALYIKVVLNL